jgi:type I restriction enzyme S subunit
LNCTTKSLGEICDIKGGKRLPKGESYINESNYYYLQVGDIDNNFINIKSIDKKNYDLLLNYKLNNHDIIISIAGTIGKIGYFHSDKNVILTENACKCTNITIKEKYLYYILNSDKSQQYFQNEYKQVTIPKLSLSNLSNLQIPVPSLEIQDSIVKTCEYWDQQIDNLKAQNELLESNNIIHTVLSSITQSLEPEPETINETIEKFTNIVESAQEELEQAIKPKKKITKKTKSNEI